MKTLNWSVFMVSRREPGHPGWLGRVLGLFFRRAVPVDGCDVPTFNTPRREPVRWGNFR